MYKRQIQSRITRLKQIETMSEDGTFDVLPKKEVIELRKEWDKLERNLGGIKDMKDVYKRQGFPYPAICLGMTGDIRSHTVRSVPGLQEALP